VQLIGGDILVNISLLAAFQGVVECVSLQSDGNTFGIGINVLNSEVTVGYDGSGLLCPIVCGIDVIKTADHVIDLGPEGGDGGGTIVATGTPEQVAAIEASYTGQFLKKML